MRIHYPTFEMPASPEYVLDVLRENHRQQCQYDPEAEPEIVLSFDSTIADWRRACDLVSWRRLARALNDGWSISVPIETWCEVLDPASEKTLEGVCRLIAAHTRRLLIRPARVFGATCETAGAFLTIRSLLHEHGVCVDAVRPSTPLAPYARWHAGVFLGPIAELVPGALPLVQIRHPFYSGATWGIALGAILGVAGLLPGFRFLTALGALIWLPSWALTWLARFVPPASVTFGDAETFGDLARAIACAPGFRCPHAE